MKLHWVYIFVLLPFLGFGQFQVSTNATLKIDSNATLYIPQDITNDGNIQNDGTMLVDGNWTNNGTYVPTGLVIFQGGNQQIDPNGHTFYDVIITGSSDKSVISRMYIADTLELDNGFLVPIDTAKIVLLENAATTIGSDQSFVRGTLYAKGEGSKYYPIGMNSLFLPAELHSIVGENPILGISVHEFENTPTTGTGTRKVFDNAYWEMEVLSGSYSDAKISLAIVPEVAIEDSLIVVQAVSPTQPFDSIGNNPDYVSSIPIDNITSSDTAKGPIFAIGVLLDVNWDLLYIPNALSKNATNPEETCIKIYGGVFKSENFNFTITNQWGNVIFQTNSITEMETIGWTGVNQKTSKRETTGQYFYYIKGVGKDSVPYEKAGSLWIID